MQQTELFEKGNMLFTLKDITPTPETPRLKEPFAVKGKIELFKIPFLAPIWVQVKVTYPEAWWEEIIPIIGAPTVAEGAMVIGGNFEIAFPRGFEREGEFLLDVEVYAGPTYSVDKMMIPPFPPVATEKTTFIVAGEVPPEEVGFRSFRILSYSKNDGPPVTPPGVLELDIGDRCRVNVGFDHMDGAVTGKFYAAIWQKRLWDPHDEVLHADKSFSVPSSPDWQPVENYIDIIITSAISPGTEYGLYVKIMGITGGDIFTEYLANVITIKGIPAVGECRELKITSYDSVSPPSVLEVRPSDTIRVTSEFDYFGPATTGKLYSALWHPSWYDPHDEIAHGEKSITLPDSPEGNHITEYVDIRVPSGFAGTDFGLYTKVTGALKDAMSPYYDNIIAIVGVPPASDLALPDPGFEAIPGTYDLGDSVPWSMVYQYKGKAQSGYLTISLGTGVYPSFFTKHTFPRVSVSFDEAMDWTPSSLSGSFTLPTTLESGQTYNVRAKLETADGVQETDTDWTVITIEEVAPPTSDIASVGFHVPKGTYDIGDTIHYELPFQYKGKAQGGRLTILLRHPVVIVLERDVTFEESFAWTWHDESGSFTLPDTLEPGKTYTAEATLRTADGAQEIGTEYGVITIREEVPVPPKADIADWDFRAEAGTYEVGDRVPFTASYKYKGKSQNGQLTIELGTGLYPSFFSKVIYSPMPVDFEEAMDWESHSLVGTFLLTEALELGRTYSVRAKLEALVDKTQETDTDWGVITIREVAVGISFQVGIWGIPAFGSYQKWWAYYFDPGINDFVDCGKWYYSYQKITFSNVQSGGYLAVFLMRNSTVSPQYTSPTFEAVDGGSYQYDVQLGRVS